MRFGTGPRPLVQPPSTKETPCHLFKHSPTSLPKPWRAWHACRAGCTAPRHGPLEKIGSVLANGGRMMSVGRFEPNAWGLHDMSGNVWEWCADWYSPRYHLDTSADEPLQALFPSMSSGAAR